MRMYLLTIQFVLITILLILEGVRSLRWLGINNSLVDESDEQDVRRYLCSSSATAAKNRLLDKDQKRICRKKIKMMKYVVTAAELAKTECLRLTKYERWNCRGILLAPKFSRDLRVGTRESAFLHALSSAALVFAVTQGCAADERCDCGRIPSRSLLKRHERKHPGKKYQYGGCHDNIAVGIRFSKDFLDRRELRQTKPADRKLVNLHNNDVGRKIVRDSLSLDCKCHGMTASCSIHTCTRFLPMDFRGIANKLFQLYKKALQVELADDASGKRKELVLKKQKVGEAKKKLHATDIVYLLKSRDFCIPDTKNKLPGTKGRACGRKYIGNFAKSPFVDTAPINVCDHLCCGRKHITARKRTTLEKCKCKFYIEIMDVKCKNCHLITEIYSCS